jgi:hypothetical protein
MSLQFNNIANDDRYSFLPKDLRQNFRNAVEKAGRRNIVFVEGYDDEVIYTILYEGNLKEFCFIDIGFTSADPKATKTGNCEKVKQYLKYFVQHLPKDKRFYGVIDRDLKTDQEVKEEKNKHCYDGRLFIFFERYTLENYFVEPDILYEFLKGQSIKHKKQLIPILKQGKEHFETEVIKPILTCLTDIAAANLTIRSFDSSEKFLEDSISCEEIKIKNRVVHKLESTSHNEDSILSEFSKFQKELIDKNEPLKFASAKGYFATQFNHKLKKQTGVNIQLNNHKSELARILKERGIPKDFRNLLSLIRQ